MTFDVDNYRSAAVMIGKFGSDAAAQATARAGSMGRKGDHEGQLTWDWRLRSLGQSPGRWPLHRGMAGRMDEKERDSRGRMAAFEHVRRLSEVHGHLTAKDQIVCAAKRP